jgi:oligoendopeptidase F
VFWGIWLKINVTEIAERCMEEVVKRHTLESFREKRAQAGKLAQLVLVQGTSVRVQKRHGPPVIVTCVGYVP